MPTTRARTTVELAVGGRRTTVLSTAGRSKPRCVPSFVSVDQMIDLMIARLTTVATERDGQPTPTTPRPRGLRVPVTPAALPRAPGRDESGGAVEAFQQRREEAVMPTIVSWLDGYLELRHRAFADRGAIELPDGTPAFILYVRDHGGHDHVITQVEDPEQAWWLEQRLERHLGVSDHPVHGEHKRRHS